MTKPSVVFALDKILRDENGKSNMSAYRFMWFFVRGGWQVYIHHVDPLVAKKATRKSYFVKHHIIGLPLWDQNYFFDLAVDADLETGPVSPEEYHLINAKFILQFKL